MDLLLKNGNKCLTFGSIDKNEKVLEKYAKLWDECNSTKYKKDYTQIKFNLDDGLPLNNMPLNDLPLCLYLKKMVNTIHKLF